MEQLYLIYFIDASTPWDEVYNPSQIPAFRGSMDSEAARALRAKPGDVVLIKKVGAGQFEIIRRAKYPLSHNDFVKLVSNENGNGGGTENTVVALGEDELFNMGTPIGLFDRKNLPIWILMALALYVILND